MNVLETAKRIIHEGPICDHCMGRQFAKLSTGLTNDERGRAIKLALAMEGDRALKDGADDTILTELSPSSRFARMSMGKEGEDEECWVCLGLFNNLDVWAERAVTALGDFECSTFLVGTKMSGLLSENEEILWTESGATHAEQFKSELNREVGKLIAARVGNEKEVEFKQPDVLVTLNLAKEDISLQVRSVYIQGRYRKLVRGIPQTRWPCRKCKGKGCDDCNQTGKQYPESVDELVSAPLIKAAQSTDTKFHGAGREDIDALMLGSGRPFVIEAVRPVVRTIDLDELTKAINDSAAGKVEVGDMKFVYRDAVEILKTSKADKVYNLKVTFKELISEDKLKSAIDTLSGVQIDQRTPQRVVHRRADLVRKRYVHSMGLTEFTDEFAMVTVHCEGGLYVKELVSGDDKRTIPNLTELIGTQATVTELDVIKVDI
ncbi:MAG TPA: tRNA pseudouridine(54/55) synthase Pus10 [Methanosarcinaceae archaeon]|nr:tRNA pseudouridine(54/55) synthase Pus10 [Methanosarcinaceae archaeon]